MLKSGMPKNRVQRNQQRGRCRYRWKSREKTNIRTKRYKGTLHPKCVESVMEEQLISFAGFELTCCYIKDVLLTVVP